ncbi:MAG TPA: alpha/beta fold hydrolase [Rubrobacter sp.]|nr:alpha/beta fold hydrolase [Rubrobacter sp.]
MREAFVGSSSGLHRPRFVWLALSSLVGVLVGLLVLVGESGAQSAVPPFLVKEGTPPPGANIPCDPKATHPYPVVLVHGTFETMDQNWAVLSPRLKDKGYCVFALNYGRRGTGRIGRSAQELGRFVDNVLAYTGAGKVQLVGHSQGGMMPRYWIKYLGGRSEVEDLVGIAPSNYGTKLGDSTNVDSTPADWGLQGRGAAPNPCYACDQQGAGSRFIRRLNNGDDTPGPGAFTQIATDDDEIIIPYTRCFLRGEERTKNLTLQDYNRGLVVTHQNIYNDPFVQKLVFDALANPGTAKPARAFD